MRHDLNIDLVFPIKDEVSAWLMSLKAESLCAIGIIDTGEMSAVLEPVAAVLDQADPVDRESALGILPTRSVLAGDACLEHR
jgi:hypothetical protein